MIEHDQDTIQRALTLLEEAPLIDGHNDFPYMLRGFLSNDINGRDLANLPLGQTDLDRLKKGRIGGQFWSAFVPCVNSNDDAAPDGDLLCLRKTIQQIDVIHLLIENHANKFGLAATSDDILNIFKSGRIASLIGIEGLHQVANSASVLRMYHRLGVRYVTLCHNCNNDYADSATSSRPSHKGLSEQGRDMIREMNRIGMIVDLSHTSNAVQLQTLRITKAPLIFSHSCCATLCPHVRNVTDDVLHMLRKNNGVLMVCFLPSLLSSPSVSTPSVKHVVDHIVYAGQLIGFEHVGIGSDFDGMLTGPQNLDDVSTYPNLVAEMILRGISEFDIKKILAHNIIRVLKDVEDVSHGMKSEESSVMCDQIEQVWTEEQLGILLSTGSQRSRMS